MNKPSFEMIEAIAALALPAWGSHSSREPLPPFPGWLVGFEFFDDPAPGHLASVVKHISLDLGERIGLGWALRPGYPGHLRLEIWGDN